MTDGFVGDFWQKRSRSSMAARSFIAVDWGTTNRRAYHIADDGTVLCEHEDGLGILSIEANGFPKAIADLCARFDDLPVLMAGMIGSNRGWVEVPYVMAPAGPLDLARAAYWVEPGRVAIIPGVSFDDGLRADVMRGEEVQVIGAVAAGLVDPDSLVCHPGTHNKWIELQLGSIASFRTVLTGELFNLLRQYSILSDLLVIEAQPDETFVAGVDHALAHDDLTAELFAVRARVLLGKRPREAAASYISGLLIGSDLRVGLGRQRHDEIMVMGRPALTRLYAAALSRAGRVARQINGEQAFIAGMGRMAEAIL